MTDRRSADVAVIGLGAMGSMTAWRLARRGVKVIAFERFEPGHPFGSSHGDTRMIRAAGRGPDYVPWVREAFDLWRELERESRSRLLTQTGALLIGRAEGALVSAALEKSRAHALPHELLSRSQVGRRFPQHVLAAEEVALYERLGGLVRPELAITSAAGLAQASGAVFRTETEVLGIDASAAGIQIQTNEGSYRAEHLVVAVGAWTRQLLPDLELALHVERQVLVWLDAAEPGGYEATRFPVFTHELDGPRYVYGFPSTDSRTVKVAAHHGGTETDPTTLDRAVHPDDLAPVEEFAREHLRGLGGPATSAVCMYTNTDDGLFHVTGPAGRPGVLVVNACNGDGFKFAPVIGEALAAHVVEGRALPALLCGDAPAASRARGPF